MRRLAEPTPLTDAERMGLIDNCGTGGDGLSTFNISTASALVAASLGARLAKHGNRSVSSKCGSADLLYEAGYPDDLTHSETRQLLNSQGFAFFFAPAFHPSMKHVMPARKALGVRSIFNFLGPLVHPVAPQYQLLGVGHRSFHQPVANALLKLGIDKAAVVHSRDGLDEISPCAPTDMIIIEKDSLSHHIINPKDFITPVSLEDISGGDVKDNLLTLNRLLGGEDLAVKQAIIINAGACLWVCGRSESLEAGCQAAKRAIETLTTKKYFETLIKHAQKLRSSR